MGSASEGGIAAAMGSDAEMAVRWDQVGATFEAVVVGSASPLRLQWVRTPITSHHGTTGLASANDGKGERRIHVCKHSPCSLQVRLHFGRFHELPTHVLRLVVDMPTEVPPPAAPAFAVPTGVPTAPAFAVPPEVPAEAAPSHEPPAAVTPGELGPPNPAAPQGPLVATTPPGEMAAPAPAPCTPPLPAALSAGEGGATGEAGVPSPPQGSPLEPLGHALGLGAGGPVVSAMPRAPLPAVPDIGGAASSVVVAAAPEPSLCQSSAIVEQVVALSREMGKKGAYVGQVAFVLLALKRKMRLHLWVGAERVDVIEKFAPWAMHVCREEALGDTILSRVVVDEDTGLLQVFRVTDDASAIAANHFVACLPCDVGHHDDGVADDGWFVEDADFVGYYQSAGVLVVHTVRDGDCAFDAMCVMLGEPRTEARIAELRFEVVDYMLKHAENTALHLALRDTGELSIPHDGGGVYQMAHALRLWDEPGEDESGEEAGGAGGAQPAGEPPPDLRQFPELVVNAMAWASGLQKCDEEKAIALCRSLPPWCLDEQVRKYSERRTAQDAQDAEPSKSCQKGRYSEQRAAQGSKNTSSLLLARECAAKKFEAFLKEKGIETRGQRLPYGTFPAYFKANPDLAERHKTKREQTAFRFWLFRAWRGMRTHGEAPDVSVRQKLPRDGGAATDRRVWDKNRRRRRGLQGRPQKAPLVRSLLFEWFSVLRRSVAVRIPPKLMMMKASTLVEDYVKECLVRGVKPDPPMLTSKWLGAWMRQYRVSLRRPNRKYKVPMLVLQERLVIFWTNLARVRTAVLLLKGHDPHMTNIDQSPYHRNEAGSQGATTLSVKGAPIVALKEGHAATRARYSVCTTTCSDFLLLASRIPGLEIMFKADGDKLEARLQGYIRACGYPTWLSVVTGPKGSYREEHVLSFLETHLEPWHEGREWRILGMDAYAPQMTDNVRRLAWSRGYLVVIHGGGATGITQTNDTDLHQHQRRQFTGKEMAEMVRMARLNPSRMPFAMAEQCIDWQAEVWNNRNLHDQARKGFKYTGCTNALDGSEDHLIAREARVFWDKHDVSAKRDAACHDVHVEVEAGRLRWGYEAVYSLVAPFPHRGALDATIEFQDDEEVAPAAGEDAWSDSEDSDGEAPHDGGSEAAEEAESQEDSHAGPEGDDDGGLSDAGTEGDDGALRDGGEVALSAAQADTVCESSSRISVLQQVIDQLEGSDLITVAQTLRRALHEEHRASVGTGATDAGVAQAMRQQLGREDQAMAKQRRRVQCEMEAARVAKKAKTEAKEFQARVASARKRLREAHEMQETQDALKTFSPEMLGAGLLRGGGAAFRNRRKDVLNRLAARGAAFSARGKNDWDWFVETWDAKMCAEHGREWGTVFAEQMHHVASDLAAGAADAMATFMANETQRVLREVVVLQL